MTTSITNLEALAHKVAAAMPDFNETERETAVGLYRLLARGEPVLADDLAQLIDVSPKLVSESLGGWPGVYFDDQKRVVAFWGLALPKTPHSFKVDGRQLYTWCAWDSLFIPEILGKTAEVESTCPVTGGIISLTVGPARVESFIPASTVVSFRSPSVPFDANVVMSFCHYVLFFSSEDAGARWAADHENTVLLAVDEAHEIGHLANKANFGELI